MCSYWKGGNEHRELERKREDDIGEVDVRELTKDRGADIVLVS